MEALVFAIGFILCAPFLCIIIMSIGTHKVQVAHKREKERLMGLLEKHPEQAGHILQSIRDLDARHGETMKTIGEAYDHLGRSYDGFAGKPKRSGSGIAGMAVKAAINAASKRPNRK